MRKFSLAISAMLMLGGCASTPSNTLNDRDEGSFECPTTGAGLTDFKTEKHVLSCLGNPINETSKPDGRHTGLYEFNGGITIVYLYDANGNVIKNQVYKGGN